MNWKELADFLFVAAVVGGALYLAKYNEGAIQIGDHPWRNTEDPNHPESPKYRPNYQREDETPDVTPFYPRASGRSR